MEETFVPGLNRKKEAQNEKAAGDETMVMYPSDKDSTVPVVGFLYSLSKEGVPEWWPLYIGQNKIGKADHMDICLKESSISSHHANINLKRLRRSGNALAASLVDVGSKTGILLNDEELDYEPRSLHNEDVITFGLNYKCVILLIDPTKYGLEPSSEFVAVEAEQKSKTVKENDEFDPFDDFEQKGGTIRAGYNPEATVSVTGDGIDLSVGKTKIL